jgi:hypothetical protein
MGLASYALVDTPSTSRCQELAMSNLLQIRFHEPGLSVANWTELLIERELEEYGDMPCTAL